MTIRPIKYDALLSFDETVIRLTFPNGAVQAGKDRWVPAEKKPDRTLAKLLRDKKDRMERPRFLAASSAHKLRWDKRLKRWVPLKAHPDQDVGYTDTPHGAMKPDVGQGLDEETLKRFAKEANDRDAQRADLTPLWEKLKQLEHGLTPRQKESIRRRIEAARRASNKQAA